MQSVYNASMASHEETLVDVETIAWGYGLVEGPRLDEAGNLYFSDVQKGGVFRRAPDGAIETLVPRRRGVGGIALHADGGLVISGRDICHVREGKSRRLFARDDIPGFNDITVDDEGRVLCGSMRSDPFQAEADRKPGELWRIDAEGKATELYGGVGLSNGIGYSPDRTRLYHSDSAARAVIVHDVAPDGSLSNRRALRVQRGAPDGLAIDVDGGVWVALYGAGCAARLDASGALDRLVEVPARAVTSLCFGGPDHCDLYVVTADNTEHPSRGGTIFRTRSDVAGLPTPPVRI